MYLITGIYVALKVLNDPRYLDNPHAVAKELVDNIKNEEPDAFADNGAISRAIPLGNQYIINNS